MSSRALIPYGFSKPCNVKFGDHVSFRGIYVGLIVDLSSDWSICTVAMRNPTTRKVTEVTFASETLRPVEARR